MSSPTDAPDWPALVSAEGADPGIVSGSADGSRVHLGLGPQLLNGLDATISRSPAGGFTVRFGYDDARPVATAMLAVRAALAWLRETLRREIAERQAARKRLGP